MNNKTTVAGAAIIIADAASKLWPEYQAIFHGLAEAAGLLFAYYAADRK